jgi:DNA-binding winged helix-turn-helix (wHTH) protein
MDVVLLRWPIEDPRRQRLQAEGAPRLLLVEGAAAAPRCDDCVEDWIRVPADEADVRARVEALARRHATHEVERPDLDRDGLLRFSGGWVSLPPVEARVMAALIDRYETVVSRDQLARAGWPKGAPGRNALDVHVLRLRRRIAPVDLVIKTVRSRGYLLEPAATQSAGAYLNGNGVARESVTVS